MLMTSSTSAAPLVGQPASRFEDAVGVSGEAHIGRTLVRAVARKASCLAVFAPAEHGRQPLRHSELGDLRSVHQGDAVRVDQHRIGARGPHALERIIDLRARPERHIEKAD